MYCEAQAVQQPISVLHICHALYTAAPKQQAIVLATKQKRVFKSWWIQWDHLLSSKKGKHSMFLMHFHHSPFARCNHFPFLLKTSLTTKQFLLNLISLHSVYSPNLAHHIDCTYHWTTLLQFSLLTQHLLWSSPTRLIAGLLWPVNSYCVGC